MIWSSHDAKEIDLLSSNQFGIPSLQLMNEAGQAIFRLALSLWSPYTEFLVLAGAGNNGGDAFVAARLLRKTGFSVRVIDVSEGRETIERKTVREEYEESGGRTVTFAEGPKVLPKDFILIDGLLGIGLKGKLRDGLVKDCLTFFASQKSRAVIAIDLPSGMDADLWEQDEPILKATHTITFGALKPVHVGQPSRKHCGDIRCVKICFAPPAIAEVLDRQNPSLIHANSIPHEKSFWSHLKPDAHKYDRGHVLAIGGSPGKIGAILIAAEAAWNIGAGWVSVAPLSDVFAPSWPKEFTYEDFALDGVIDERRFFTFLETRKVKGLLIGPGTMVNPLTKSLLKGLAEVQGRTGLKIILDAGALADILELTLGLNFDPMLTLLTPHPGEWRKLSKEPMPLTGLRDLKGEALNRALKQFTIIYKSATPIVLTTDQTFFLTQGDNRLARAGSGDKLAGTVLGLSASQNLMAERVVAAQNWISFRTS